MSDGQQALDYLLRRGCYMEADISPKPDLVLLDISVPIVDGYGVLEVVKNSEELRSIPVIVLTSTNNQKEIDSCHAMGTNGYLVKNS